MSTLGLEAIVKNNFKSHVVYFSFMILQTKLIFKEKENLNIRPTQFGLDKRPWGKIQTAVSYDLDDVSAFMYIAKPSEILSPHI